MSLSLFVLFVAVMVHRLTALILIPLLLCSNLSILMVVAGFELNRGYIEAKLCENRDRPQLNCNGRCYLSKKLKQAEENERKQEQEIQKQFFQASFLPESFFVFYNTKTSTTIETPYKDLIVHDHNSIVFQPPEV